jgi:hypothetical protein
VVHVGLEMLVSLIDSAATTSSAIIIDSSTADFIRQMFFSSESAINILNDLLQYEHIEAGTSQYISKLGRTGIAIRSILHVGRNFQPLL